MKTILVSILLLADIIKYFVIFDVILSWLVLFWLKIRPKFVWYIIDPIYKKIKDLVPSSFWTLDFTPIIVIFLLLFIKGLIFSFDINIQQYYLDITNF